MTAILQFKLCFKFIRFLLSICLSFFFVANTYADMFLSVNPGIYFKDSVDVTRKITFPKKNFLELLAKSLG